MNDEQPTMITDPRFDLALARARATLIILLERRGYRVDEAEDLAHEACLRAIRHRADWDPSRDMVPWLWVIAIRRARDLGRRRACALETDVASDLPEPIDILMDDDVRARVARAIEGLPPLLRRVVRAFYDERQSVRVIAERLGIPEGTVKSHLHRARSEVARRLDEGDRK